MDNEHGGRLFYLLTCARRKCRALRWRPLWLLLAPSADGIHYLIYSIYVEVCARIHMKCAAGGGFLVGLGLIHFFLFETFAIIFTSFRSIHIFHEEHSRQRWTTPSHSDILSSPTHHRQPLPLAPHSPTMAETQIAGKKRPSPSSTTTSDGHARKKRKVRRSLHHIPHKPPHVEPAPQDPVFIQGQLLRSISAAVAMAGFDSAKPTALEMFRAAVEECTFFPYIHITSRSFVCCCCAEREREREDGRDVGRLTNG